MGIEYRDVKPRLEIIRKQREAERLEQARIAQGVGQTMAELLTDPRWQLYCNHIQAVLDPDRKRLNALRDKLSGLAFLNEVENGQARVDAAYAKGHGDALEWAMGLVKQLVERGEAAKETLAMEETDRARPSGT